jgi:hypothetical protein
VYLEVGTDAPDTTQLADAFPVAMHVKLNGIKSATNLDRPDRNAVMVRLDDDDRNRLYLVEARVGAAAGSVRLTDHVRCRPRVVAPPARTLDASLPATSSRLVFAAARCG